jgi:uncharacterized repeat protein (TIGR03843 family)
VTDGVLKILETGEMNIRGEFVWGSNYTFLGQVEYPEGILPVVYKPSRGEQPLWDFPPASLAKREVAAYLVSEGLGWNLVPPTVYRDDAPFGPGSVQLFIEHDPEYHYFSFSPEDRQRLRPVAIFDYLINNADRKGGHVLLGPDGSLWLIDHGVCFHVQEKLRTVIWDFSGEVIPEALCEDVSRFHHRLTSPDWQSESLMEHLRKFLSNKEIGALARRADRLVSTGLFPTPDPHRRHYPWPQL